jgi:uncharacterized protein (TIGR02271 family)
MAPPFPPPRSTPDASATVPVVEERLEVGRRAVVTGGVRLVRSVETREVVVDEPLRRETLDVERVPVGRTLADDEHPTPRDDGDVLVVPVVEEVLVVERRRVLKEELRIRRVRATVRAPQRIEVSADRVMVQRLDADGHPAGDDGAGRRDR